VLETGIRLPAGDGKVAYALRSEMGEALANAMIDHEIDHDGADRTHVVAAPRAHTFDDVAAALTEVSGTTVRYTQISDDEYVEDAVRAGLPEHLARRFLGFYSDIRDNQLDQTSSDLEALLGREPATLPAGLREVFAL
jgi:NAD(P)H dehydrogenase (quinone)